MQPPQHPVQPCDSRSVDRESDALSVPSFRLLSERSGVRLSPGARSGSALYTRSTGQSVANQSAKRTTAAALQALLLPLLGLAAVLVGISHDAPVGGWVGHDVAAVQKPAAEPTWDTHGGEKGCRPMREGELADVVLVVTQQGDTVRMGFDRAWGMATDAGHVNDVYVIGSCR